MKYLYSLVIFALASGIFLVGAESANAQSWKKEKKARKEYRKDIREARKDYRKSVRNGDNYRDARREYRDDRRDARRDYRDSTGRRINNGYYTSGERRRLSNGYYISRSRRAYPQQSNRVYYRNGRRYVRSY